MSKNIEQELLNKIPEIQKNEVFNQPLCDIDGTFLGFIDIYKHLAEIIPHHFTIIDFGCAYAPQCFYFTKHKKYIGVNNTGIKRFSAKNTIHYNESIEKFIKHRANSFDKDRVFAICSYVPPWGGDNMKMVRDNFKNVFTYYPAKNNGV